MKKWILLIGLLSLSLAFGQVNIIQNGGFESWTGGMADHWTLKSNDITMTQETGTVHGGTSSAKIVFTSTSTQKLGQTVNVNGDTQYTFNFYVLDNDTNARVRIWGYWNLAGGGSVTLNPGDLYTIDDPNWQLYTYTTSSPTDAISLDFEIRFYDTNGFPAGQGVIYLDDVEILGPSINAPTIDSLTYVPFAANQPIDITCQASVSSGTVDEVKFFWYTDLNAANVDSVVMTPAGGNDYTVSLPAMANGSSLTYWVKAYGNGAVTPSAVKSVLIGTPDIGMFHTQLDTNALPLHLDHLARLKGIVTVGTGVLSTSNTDFYMQDATGGINVFAFGTGAGTYAEGDSLEVVGKIAHFNGKVEIVDFNATVLSSGNPLPDAIDVNIEDMGEEFEGRLVQIDNVSLDPSSDPWPTTPGTSVNLVITDGTGTLTMRIVASTDIIGNPEPTWPVTVTGIASQYDFSAPHTEGYQLLPRAYSDFAATGISGIDPVVTRYELFQNHPNPFNPETLIRFNLKKAGETELRVFNILGQVVFQQKQLRQAGAHEVRFDGRQLPSGIYFYQLKSGNFKAVKKMILTR